MLTGDGHLIATANDGPLKSYLLIGCAPRRLQAGKEHMARGRIMVMGKAKTAPLLAFQLAEMNVPPD